MACRWAKALSAVAIYALVALVQIPTAGAAAAKPDPNATLKVGQGGSTAISGWDANKYGGGNAYATALMMVYDRLLQLDGTTQDLKPMLATSWKWDSTNTKLTMPLRKDVKFWDGAPFNAAVAVQNIKRSAEKDSGISTTQLATMTDVSAVDEYTLQVTFSQPNPAIVYQFAYFGGMMISPNALASPAGIAALKTTPAGSGSYKYIETTGDLTVKFDRWDAYWDKSHVFPAHYWIYNIVDENTRHNGVKTGVVDMASLTAYTPAQKDPALNYVIIRTSAVFVMAMNDKLAPFDKVDVRKAVDMTLNRPAFEASQSGQCVPLYQQLPEGVDGFIKNMKPAKPDITAAKKLIADSGASGAKITLLAYNIEPWMTFTKIIQAQLGQIGLNVELVPVSASVGRATYRGGTYHAVVTTQVPGAYDDPQFFVDQFALGADNPGSKSTTVQTMADKARALPLGSKDRTTAYQDINKYLMANPIWAPLCAPNNVWAFPKGVTGVDKMPGNRLTSTPDSHFIQVTKTK